MQGALARRHFFLALPWRALNLGFDLQITYTRPRRFTTWQSLWRIFRERSELVTFMAVLKKSDRARS